MKLTKKVLKNAGVDPRRLVLEWVSASEGARFVELVTKFTDQIRMIGPLGKGEGEDPKLLPHLLKAAKEAVEGKKLRWVAAKLYEFTQQGNMYGEVFTEHEIERMLDEIVMDECSIRNILLLTKEEGLSVKAISKRLNLPPPRVLRHIVDLKRMGQVVLDRIDGTSPLYKAV